MKKYGIIAALVAVVVAGIVGWRMLRGRDDSMASSLPADITMVGRVDVKTLVMDYGLDLGDLKDLLFADKKETGIKFQTAAYIFATQNYFGGILALSDNDDFEAMLQEQGIDTEEQRGMKWGVINDNMLFAIDDDRVMWMGPAVGSEQDALRNTIYSCLKQSASESGKQSRIYKLLDQRKEPVALSTNMAALPEELRSKYLKYLPGDLPLGDLDVMAGFTAHKDRMSLSLGLSSENKSVNKQLDKFNDVLDKIDGDLVKTTPPNSLFHIEMGVDGEDLLKLLRENKILRTALLAVNMVIDFDKILKSIDGDVALTCLDFASDMPNLMFQAKLDSDNFMKDVSDWNDASTEAMGLSFYSQGKNNAVCIYGGLPVYFGTRDKRLTISNTEALVKAEAYADVQKKFASDMKGCRIYAMLNLSKLKPVLAVFSPAAVQYLDNFDRVTLRVTDVREIRLDLITRDGVDILKELSKNEE